MMNAMRFKASALLLTAMTALKVHACGPYFPVSYFPHDYGFGLAGFSPLMVATNAANKSFDAYSVTPHLGTELAMIGAHYYPEWTGKAPKGNHISTAHADEMDFFAAGGAASVPNEILEEDWRQFTNFCGSVCKRLEGGEKVEIPSGVPDYAREFYLYKLGHAQWLVFRKDEDPPPFGQLLALPREQRLYRTVWVHFVRIANARECSEKDRHVDALRKALDAGFKDTAALESYTLRFLSATCGKRYDPLVLTSYAGAAWEEWPGFAKRIFFSRPPSDPPEKEHLAALCADPVGVEVAIAYGAGGYLPDNVAHLEKPALGADRQAWIAFNSGDLDLCRKLLALAPRQSLIRLFLEARLARLAGDYESAGKLLHAWLDEYREKGRLARDAVTGYGISTEDEAYWATDPVRISGYGFSSEIHYSGAYGPAGRLDLHGVRGSFRDYDEPGSQEPSLPRVVAGELGVVMVATRDLEEALYAFLLARNWIDVAFVAERCMTVDELAAFMRGNRIEPHDKGQLGGLLMRRLMRCGRLREAAAWAPPDLKPLCDEFCALAAEARDAKADADTRAVAYLNLSRLTATRGMELMGTELRPDVGYYATDAHPLAEPSDLPSRLGPKEKGFRWAGWKAPEDRVTGRFHYRRKAIKYARTSVLLAKDPDVRAWALMFGGVVTRSLDDVQEADWFYKRLASMRHPRAKVGDWFNGPVYQWFRDTYYHQERQAVPMRVPRRFTKDQLSRMTAPPPK